VLHRGALRLGPHVGESVLGARPQAYKVAAAVRHAPERAPPVGRDSSGHDSHGGVPSGPQTAAQPAAGSSPGGGPSCPSSLVACPAQSSCTSCRPTQSVSQSTLLSHRPSSSSSASAAVMACVGVIGCVGGHAIQVVVAVSGRDRTGRDAPAPPVPVLDQGLLQPTGDPIEHRANGPRIVRRDGNNAEQTVANTQQSRDTSPSCHGHNPSIESCRGTVVAQ
jgi:hypothetical protein